LPFVFATHGAHVDVLSGDGVRAGMGKKDLKTMQLKEVKNGRLAMLACGGILHQQLLSKVPTIAFFGDFKPLTIGY
jgi:hypothetical protein